MRNNLNLALSLLADLYYITQISNAVVDLDLVVQELLKSGDIEDLVGSGLRSIDDELNGGTYNQSGFTSNEFRGRFHSPSS